MCLQLPWLNALIGITADRTRGCYHELQFWVIVPYLEMSVGPNASIACMILRTFTLFIGLGLPYSVRYFTAVQLSP